MTTLVWVFKFCTAVGGFALLLQCILLLWGAGHDTGSDGDVHGGDHDSVLGLLSVRAITGFIAFFGLGGWWASARGWSAAASTGLGLGTGLAVMVLVAALTTLQRKLVVEGNVDPKNAVGGTARVYLRIPGQRQSAGRVTMLLQGRSVEFLALTDGEEIPTGALVTVQAMLSSDSCLVVPARAGETESAGH